MVDQATRWADMVSTPDKTSKTVVDVFKNVFLRKCGHVKEVIVDNGAEFTSAEFMEFMRDKGIKVTWVSPYHPQSNAFVERINGTFKSMLAKCVNENQENWDITLAEVNISYNQAVHSVTEFSPHYLLYGVHPVMPVDTKLPVCSETLRESPEERRMRIYKDRLKANENTCRHQLRQKIAFDKTHDVVIFKRGDEVLHRNFVRKVGTVAKFMVKWKGPYKVYERVGDSTYMLHPVGSDSDEVVMAHVNNLKKFEGPGAKEVETEVDHDSSWLDMFIPVQDYPEFYEDVVVIPAEENGAENVGENNRVDDMHNGDINREVAIPNVDGEVRPVGQANDVDPPIFPVENQDEGGSDNDSIHSDHHNDVEEEEVGEDNDDEVVALSPPPPQLTTSRFGRQIKEPDRLNIKDMKGKSYRRAKMSDAEFYEARLNLMNRFFSILE